MAYRLIFEVKINIIVNMTEKSPWSSLAGGFSN
jgi:hypothetical protein